MNKTVVGTATLSAAALTLGLAGTADAASIALKDPQDTFHGSDLRSVQVKNRDRNVVVVTTHDNLRPDPRTGSAGSVYLDTDPQDKGPEYVFTGGYFDGTDYMLVHTEGFGVKNWGKPAKGSYAMSIDYAKDQVRMRMSRAVLGRPGKIRVAVRVVGTRTDGTSTGLVDWLGEPRSFTEWVAKG